MPNFSKLPQLVHKRILEYVFSGTGMNINKKLVLLGVCHDWRLIAMPMIYHTICIAEPQQGYYHLTQDAWVLSSPSGRCWHLNVAPFNIRHVFRYAKKLKITIESQEALGDLYSLLEHVFSLDSCRPANIIELNIKSSAYESQDSDGSIGRHLQQIADFLLGVIPTVACLSLNMFDVLALFKYFSTQMLTRYSGPLLQTLRLSSRVELSHPIDFQKLTELDLSLFEGNYHILSFVEPQIIRKLSLNKQNGFYIWKYFTPVEHSGSNLEFKNLTDLRISDCEFDDIFAHEFNSTFEKKYKRLSYQWAHEIISRRIVFPSLNKLDFKNCLFVDLIFANCEFPDEIAHVSIFHYRPCSFSSCEWIIENIPTSHISVDVELDLTSKSDDAFKTFLIAQSGRKIINLNLDMVESLDPARINLPMLQTLYIQSIFFSDLLSLLPKLPKLYRLTLCDSNGELTLDLDSLTTPICPSLVKLVIGPISNYYSTEIAYSYISFLLRNLTGLRFVVFDRSHDQLVSYVNDNKDNCHHFKELVVSVADISWIYQ